MAKVSISEAARLAGITRQYFYKKYINTGVISVDREKEDAPTIDTAELFRVFGELQVAGKKETEILHEMTPENSFQITALQTEIQLLREQLNAAQDREKIANERENRLMNQIDQLTGQLDTTTRLLEHKPAPEPPKKRWWSFF